jgi:hypothetical protein
MKYERANLASNLIPEYLMRLQTVVAVWTN